MSETSLTEDLPSLLAQRLEHPLPGCGAQRLFEPELSAGRHFHRPRAGARPAAVMLLLYPHEGQWTMPLVLRPQAMKSHAGQIGLPGGAVDPGETTERAALRELEEELGVPVSGPTVLGSLNPINLFVTNFAVTPHVASMQQRPELIPAPDEVAQVLEVPLAHLLDESNYGTFRRERSGIVVSAPYINWRGHRIWGATGLMVGELIALMQEVLNNKTDSAATGPLE